MIKNKYLFSSKFVQYLQSQKIEDKEQFESFVSNAKDLLQSTNKEQYSFIVNILSALQFAYKEKYNKCENQLKVFKLYDGFPLKNQVSCIGVASDKLTLNSHSKGKFPAFELINSMKEDDLEWGILTNGKKWRLHSNLSTLPYENYLEIDFSDGEESNYRVFWQLFSLNLFLPDENGVTPLEKHIEESEEEAKIIEDHINDNIDEILENICFGFLSYAGNDRQELGEKKKKKYFNNAIYLLYRFLFIFYAESRNLLPVDDPKYKDLSLNSLLEKSKNNSLNPEGTELWDSFRDLCINIDQGKSDIKIPRYDGGLFDSTLHPFLSDPKHKLTNKYFQVVIYKLGYRIKRKEEIKINYRDLSVRSLGSLYEGILEYNLYIAQEKKIIRKNKIKSAADVKRIKKSDRVINEGYPYFSQDAAKRHDTGSYYTPEDVVNYMVQNSVRLGLEERWIDFMPTIKKYEQEIKSAISEDVKIGIQKKFERTLLDFVEEKILTYKIMDPAMGSGHFLVNSLNTITHFIIEVLQANVILIDSPIEHKNQPIDINWNVFDHINEDIDLNPSKWRRKAVEKCIFGIDINPLSTELSKLSLWIASTAEGKPLTFLNHHLKTGDAIKGIRLKDMLTFPNMREKNDQIEIFEKFSKKKIKKIKEKYDYLLSFDSEKMQNIISKKDEYEEIEKDPFLNHLKDIATIWLIISFKLHSSKKQAKIYDEKFELPDKNQYFELLNKAQKIESESAWKNELGTNLYNNIKEYQKNHKIFHWELEFPEIINNGFDTIIGNPPYVDVKEKDYIGLPLASLKSRNLYAYIPEHSFWYVKENQILSFITPMAIICSKRMINIQNVFKKESWFLYNIDSTSHPGTLFKNINTGINIFVLKKDNQNRIFTTNQKRFYKDERKRLFNNIKYHKLKNQELILGYTIPKISTNLEEKILELLFQKGKDLKKFVDLKNNKDNSIYYRSAGNPYYRLAFAEPKYIKVDGKKVESTTQKSLNLKSKYSKYVLASIFYSSLYYWFWIVYSDCFSFAPKDLYRLPIDIEYLIKFRDEFKSLYKQIKYDLDKHSKTVTYNKAKGVTKYKMFKARRSKHIFDKVDMLLAKSIGLDGRMIDFLINYDIKYRTD